MKRKQESMVFHFLKEILIFYPPLQEISDLFLTMGFGSDAIATKVGTMSAGILNAAGEGFSTVLPTRAIQKQIVQLKQAAKMEASLPTYSPHPCRADN